MIDEIAPLKEIWVKNNSQDWFDEINKEIERQGKSFAKFKKPRLHNDNKNYKKIMQQSSTYDQKRKKNSVVGKLNENTGKPKEL